VNGNSPLNLSPCTSAPTLPAEQERQILGLNVGLGIYNWDIELKIVQYNLWNSFTVDKTPKVIGVHFRVQKNKQNKTKQNKII
jgi:hypothetical protein